MSERLLAAAALQPGDTVLTLGVGLDGLTLAAHGAIGDGWVVAVDSSPAVLEELLRRAHEANASGILYLVGDAEVLPLPDASVDAALASHAARAAGELARVLRPGGRLSLRESPRSDPAVRLRDAGFVDVRSHLDGDLFLAARRQGR